MARKPQGPLRTGFTTGACATAAASAACGALLNNVWTDPVRIVLPRGETPEFALSERVLGPGWARAAVVKDAGDDPDVTHGATIRVTVRQGVPGAGIRFSAGEGVGRVTRPGLPVPPGAPAINPVPRQMMRDALGAIAKARGVAADFDVEVAIPGGAELARRTWNPRLGIEGGLSILGTTGIVRPYSCAAWIASIHRGIDVARAAGLDHVCGATGATSERVAQAALGLPDHAMLDMGDFAGGMLKYLARHPVDRITIAGGFGKLVKLAQGARDLHSGRSQVDFAALAVWAEGLGLDPAPVAGANTAMEALSLGGDPLAALVAEKARETAQAVIEAGGGTSRRAQPGAQPRIDVMIVDRSGRIRALTTSIQMP